MTTIWGYSSSWHSRRRQGLRTTAIGLRMFRTRCLKSQNRSEASLALPLNLPFTQREAWPGLASVLNEGGVVPHEGRVEDRDDDGDFLLPPDLDPMAVALAIDEKLRDARKAAGLGDDPMQLLERRAGGRVVVAGHHLLRLGDGDFAKGRQFMHGLIARIRHRQ